MSALNPFASRAINAWRDRTAARQLHGSADTTGTAALFNAFLFF
jgi:hypothetical protein